MKLNKLVLGIIVLSLFGTIAVYPSLPQIIPIHWNASGQVNGTGSRNTVFLLALLPAVIFFLMYFLPKIDPKKESYVLHEKAYTVTLQAVVLMLVGLHWIAILAALGNKIDVSIFVRVMLGIIFIVMGNYMGQIRHNYFFGIRTPWTLANETVWQKTHRVGGYGFILSGVVALATILLKGSAGFIITIGIILAVSVYTFIYSYIEYRKLLLKR